MAKGKSIASQFMTEAFRAEADKSRLFQSLTPKLRKLSIDGEDLYVAEGDTLLDEDQLRFYLMQREAAENAMRVAAEADRGGIGTRSFLPPMRAGLIGMTENGKIVRWKPDTVLSYRVVKNTFLIDGQYAQIVKATQEATLAWESTCGVKFEYRADLDAKSGTDGAGALFAVRYFDSFGAFIASAFFPNDPVNRRRLLIDPSFFEPGLQFDRVGVLRHELGHVLGLRHEHIRSGAPPVCPQESTENTIDLTKYDPQSVMHYFCGGVGSRDLKITETDRVGSQLIYGPPLKDVRFV